MMAEKQLNNNFICANLPFTVLNKPPSEITANCFYLLHVALIYIILFINDGFHDCECIFVIIVDKN